ETHAQNFGFPGGEAVENFSGGFGEALIGSGINRRHDGVVLDEIPQVGVFVVANGGFHGNGFFGNFEDLADLVFRHFHALAEFFGRGFAPHFLKHLAGNTVEFVEGFNHVHRNTNGARLVGNRAGNGLANPPGGIGGEFVTAAVFKFVYGFHQADVAFLNQVEELQAAVGVFFGNGNDQAQVGFDHFLFGAARLGFADGHAAVDVFDLGDGNAVGFFQSHELALAAENLVLEFIEFAGIAVFGLDQ